jgi:hypothetical protein
MQDVYVKAVTDAGEQLPKVHYGDPASDPIGTVRDHNPDSPIVVLVGDTDIGSINRYWIKACQPSDKCEDRPWVSLNHEAHPQYMPNDLMDRSPVVPLAELARRLHHPA